MTERASAPARALGGLTRRSGPETGLRPAVLFAIVFCLNAAWVGFGVWVSGPWRHELEAALGPVMGWAIPILLAYLPGFVIGFMLFTLIVNPYRELELVAPAGPWPKGQWPDVTILIAARNEADAIEPTLERIAELTYPGPVEVVLADNGSTTAPVSSGTRPPGASGSPTAASSSRRPESTRRSTRRSPP